jgi:hypothetical protein
MRLNGSYIHYIAASRTVMDVSISNRGIQSMALGTHRGCQIYLVLPLLQVN